MSYESNIKIGSYGYIATPIALKTTNAGQWYPIDMIAFTNSPIEQFAYDSTSKDIIYIGKEPLYFNINYYASITSDTNSTQVFMGVGDGTGAYNTSAMETFIKTAGEVYNISGTYVIQLSKGQGFKLYVKSNQAGATITISTCTGLIKKFF